MILLRILLYLISVLVFISCTSPNLASEDNTIEPFSRYGNRATYHERGKKYEILTSANGYKEHGVASWYGEDFHKQRTSSGERYDMYALTAAHKTLPLPSYVRVKNLENGRETIVKVNDRGPFHGDRIIDLSYSAASELDVVQNGTANVVVEALGDAPTADYYIQAGAFKSERSAKKLQRKLISSNPQTNISIEKRAERYVVNLGPLATKPQMNALKALLKQQGIRGVFSFLR